MTFNGDVDQIINDESQPLSSLEAAHVQAVLQNSIEKLALMAVIVMDPSTQAQELTKSVAEEISRMISQQKQLEHRFQELIAAQPALRAMANRSNLQRNQVELQEVSAALKQATKQLCRNLRDNPNISENMAKVVAQRDALQTLFRNTVACVSLQGTVQPIIEAVLAAEHAQAQTRELIEAEKSTSALVKALRNDLVTEKAQHDQQVQDKRRAVAVLKAQVQQEKLQLAIDGSLHAKDLAASLQTGRRLQKLQLQRLREELHMLEQQLELEGSVTSATDSFLSAKASGLQDASAAWQARREEDAMNKERELEVLRAAHNRSIEVLAEAEARLKDEASAKAAHDLRAQQEAAQKAAEVAMAAKQLAAAITIQAAWRGFKARSTTKGEKNKPSKAAGKQKSKK